MINKEKIHNFICKANIRKYICKKNICKYVSKENIIKLYNKKNVRYGTAAVLVLLVVFVSIYNVFYKYQSYQKKAEQYYFEADYNMALKYYSKLEKGRKSPLWDLKIAEVYSIKGDLDTSRKYISKAKDFKSKDDDILNYLVFNEFMNKDYEEAEKDGKEALKTNPQNKKLIKTMLPVYMANKETDMAEKLVENYPVNNKSAYDIAELAEMDMILGKIQEGYSKLEDAWKLNRDEYKIYDVLAQNAKYNRDELLYNISARLSMNPNNTAYKMWIAKIDSMEKETAGDAAEILSEINGDEGGKIEIKLIQSSILQNSGKGEEADKLITNIINEKSSDYRILHTAGWYYLNKKELNKAEEYCKQSISNNEDYTDNYGFLMPEILKQEGRADKAEPYFRTALFKEPYNYNIMVNTANYYLNAREDKKRALEYYNFAEIVKPDNDEIKYDEAMIYITNKDDAQGIKFLQECIKINKNVSKYHRTLGTVYFLNGKHAEALKEIRAAYKADSNDIQVLNNAGCYYIMVEGNIRRGLYNLSKAKDAITKTTDQYIQKNIKDNYNKAKKLSDEYKKAKKSAKLKVPEFTLFY